jgi:hypothetical protein
MAQQREVSPIPPGRYWITVLGRDNMADFDAWIRDMHGAVQIETASLDQQADPPVQFLIFRVPAGRMPFLNAHQFGFPSFAGPEVTSIQDVEQSPVVPGTLDRLEQAAGKAGELATDAVLLVLALLLLSKH